MTTTPETVVWTEVTDDPHFSGITFWYLKIDDVYACVMPLEDGTGFGWFVGQGRQGNADLEPIVLSSDTCKTADGARLEATTYYLATAQHLPERP